MIEEHRWDDGDAAEHSLSVDCPCGPAVFEVSARAGTVSRLVCHRRMKEETCG